ncbi:MAG: 4-hydroxybenzoate octaprenyltransferase [Planctomycetes bacterium RBG_13_63_9]|nr:MAG: 4-hydroxybenzoate octaprenyltransferase [Planctomycetes bacterium RBG_13_63_9]
MLQPARRLLELIRFSHTLFALPPALLAAAMAWKAEPPAAPRWQDLAGILLCMVFARSAAMGFNRLADRRLDALNPRTAGRHLPTGSLGAGSVLLFVLACSVGFVAGTLLFLPRNAIPLALSLPVLLFLFAYSYTKRFAWFSHLWLGAALMLAPWASWVAIRGEILAWPSVLLGSAVLFWVAGFDMIYACQDVEFDTRMRLCSAPVRYGVAGALRLARCSHVGMIGLLLLLPLVYNQFGLVYYSGVAAIAVVLAWQHRLVRPDDLSRANQAFFHLNALVSVGLLTIGVLDLLR